MYKAYQWMAFFYIYCVLGWIWETSYVSVCKRKFVNRGFLHGPVIPIYGCGAVMMLLVTQPVQESLVLTYLAGMAGATLLELVTGWAMERLFKVRYWDYSHHKIQFGGYICLTSSLFWGVLTVLLVRVLHAPIERLVLGLPARLVMAAVAVFTILFVWDVIVSVREALDMRRLLVAAEKLREDMERLQRELSQRMEQQRHELAQRMDQQKAELAQRVDQQRAEFAQRMDQSREDFSARLDERRAELADRLAQLRQQNEERLAELRDARSRLRRRHPSATMGRMEEFLEEAQKKWNETMGRS